MDRGNHFLRFFDQVLGPWILWGLSFFWGPKPTVVSQPSRIGILKAAAIGDTVLLSGPLLDLQKKFPQAEIFLFVGGSNFQIAKLLPSTFKVVLIPIKNPFKSLLLLRKHQLDVLIDADSWPRISALLTALSGALIRVGFKTLGQNRHYCFDQVIAHDSNLHEIENYRNLVRHFHVPAESPPFDFGGSQPTNWVGLHLWPGGTQSHLKEWPLERWGQLVVKLSQNTEINFVLTGSKADQAKNQKFVQMLPVSLQSRVHNGAGVDLKKTVELLSQMKMMISVNTGILHLAAAMDIPVLGLHGPTNPRRWGPVGPKHVSLVSMHPKAAQLNLGFEYDAMEGVMEELSLAKVLDGVLELSNKNDLGLKIVH